MDDILDTVALVGGSLSGRVGTVVYARNGHGPYSYTWSTRTDPDTTYQQAVRQSFRNAAMAWPYKANAFRASWNVYAKHVGRVNRVACERHPTGFNRYMGAATLRGWGGDLDPVNAPTVFTLARHGIPLIAQVGTFFFLVRIDYDLTDPWRHETKGRIFIAQSRPQLPSVNSFKGPFRNFSGDVGHPITPPTYKVASLAFPTYGAYQKIFFRTTVIEADNRLSSQIVQSVLYI